MAHITVKINDFEGPFDLLFHLIEKNRMDIREINLSVLTSQYMDYIYSIDERDMDGMSEFLLMAATLLDIKCRLLLPLPDAISEEDARAEFLEMLAEYKRFKEAATVLNEMADGSVKNFYKGRDATVNNYFTRNPGDFLEVPAVSELYGAFMTAYSKRRPEYKKTEPGIINRENVNAEKKMERILDLLRLKRRVRFSFLINESKSREEIAVTFQGALLLINANAVRAEQGGLFDEIFLYGGRAK